MVNPQKLNIVAVGAWNPKIFNPKWIEEYILKKILNKVEMTALFNVQNIEIGYDFGGISLFPSDKSLRIEIEEDNCRDEKLIKNSTNILLRILNLLNHTPLIAIGFNVVYKFKKDVKNNKFVEFLKKNENLSIGKLKIKEYKHVLQDSEYVLSVISQNLKNEYQISFNYHMDWKNDKLNYIKENTFLEFIKKSKELMTK